MLEMELSNYVSDDANTIEIYICPGQISHTSQEVQVGWKKPFKWIQNMGQGQKSKMREYHHRDMTYSYEVESDLQRVVRRTFVKDGSVKQMYIVAIKEDVLPTHRFPCTNDIVHENDIERVVYRVNNRMFVYHDKEGVWEYVYVRYQHAANVDMKQMQSDLQRTLKRLHA